MINPAFPQTIVTLAGNTRPTGEPVPPGQPAHTDIFPGIDKGPLIAAIAGIPTSDDKALNIEINAKITLDIAAQLLAAQVGKDGVCRVTPNDVAMCVKLARALKAEVLK